jgi:hypothetical protein
MEAAEDEFAYGANECNVSMALIEYDADAPPATDEDKTVTDRGGRNGRGFGRGTYGQQGRGRR